MFILYDLIFLLFVLGCLPGFALRRKFHRGFMSRLGFFSSEVRKSLSTLRQPIWVHAVSVGEVLALVQLIEGLRRLYPASSIVLSTVTPSGNKIAKNLVKCADSVIYLPLDFSFIVRGVVNMVKPELFIIAETEIWPNLISYLNRRKVVIVTVNARISDNSFLGYRMLKFLVRSVLNKISFFCVQTKIDSERLLALGVDKEKISITGNMKFDNASYAAPGAQSPSGVGYEAAGGRKDAYRDLDADKYKSMLRLGIKDKLFVTGSTHPGEEEAVFSIYKKILPEFPNLKLLIAPRHPERAKDIATLLVSKDSDTQPVFISSIKALPDFLSSGAVFILDVMGELRPFYKLADIVFIGGSLIKKGGHNILEPAYFAKPIIFGPHMFNFRHMANLFLANKSVIQVKNADELLRALRRLLNNPKEASDLGKKAQDILLENQGATARNTKKIKELFPVAGNPAW